jgi:urease accessory protein
MPNVVNALVAKAEHGWQASLDLHFAQRLDRTVLTHREHRGPLTLQRPFYPEDEVCHVYVLHPPGGVVGGDELKISIKAKPKSHALLTTPASGKFYRSAGLWAQQSIEIDIADDAIVEWLPQETIIYEGAMLKNTMTVRMADTARFIGWEIFSLGRPASAEGFNQGNIDLNWRISVAEKPLLLERLRLDKAVFAARWGLQGLSACGTLFAKPSGQAALTAVQELIGDSPNRGVTLIDDLLVCRALDQGCDKLRGFFEQVYRLVRPDTANKALCLPRIWAT